LVSALKFKERERLSTSQNVGEWRLAKRQRIASSEWRMVNGFDHPPEVSGYEIKAG